MGVAYAPSYANLFLSRWEERFIWSATNPHLDKMIWYGRYIDDLIFFMHCGEQEILEFHTYLNNTNRNLKLTKRLLEASN